LIEKIKKHCLKCGRHKLA